MKKVLLSLGLIAGAGAANAQLYTSIGPVGSVGHSWLSNSNAESSFKLSPAIGIGLVYSKNEHWGFGTSITASWEGAKYEYMDGNQEIEASLTPVYVRVPLNLIYFFGQWKDKVRPKIYAGPSVGVKVSENYSVDNGQQELSIEGDYFKTLDLGLNAGLGLNIKVGSKTWFNIDAGYYHGLLDVVEMEGAAFDNKNRNLRLNMGVMFGL